ncbi:MAG: MaoC/PaaZ C-terminal domain-containing protein [Amphiplicatus sp.]
MPLPRDLAGRRFGPVRWEASPRRILAYRAAMAPNDAAGLDDARAPLLALPTHVATPEWLLTLEILDSLKAVMPPEEAMRGVHVSQDTRFLASIEAGDAVEVEAHILGVRATRSGAVLASRATTRRAGTEIIFSQTTAATIYRDVRADDGGEVPAPPLIKDLSDAPLVTTLRLPPGFAHVYSECAEIWNPIHTERRTALDAGLDGIIVHGTALWAAAGLALVSAETGDARHLRRLTARFAAPVPAGAAVALHARAHPVATDYALLNPNGDTAVAGLAEFGAP